MNPLSFNFIYPYLVIMERLGELLASWLYQSRRELKLLYLKHGSLTTNRLSIFLLLLFCVIPLTLYFLFSSATYSILQISVSYIFVTLLFSLSLVLVITWFKSEELFKSNVQSFSFLQITPSIINLDFFGFDNQPIQESAFILETSEETIKSNLEKARFNLQKNIERKLKGIAK